MTDARMVFTTIDSRKNADDLAKKLVESRFAACVQIIDSIQSVYRWKGRIETAQETLLVIKTTAARLAALEEQICKYHSYEIPEIAVIVIDKCSLPYLEWLKASCGERPE